MAPIEQAEIDLRRRIRSPSPDPFDFCELSNIVAWRGEWSEALSILDEALSMDIDDFERPVVSLEKANLLIALGRQSAAAELATGALALLSAFGSEPEALLRRGIAHHLVARCSQGASRQTEAVTAVALLDEAIARTPDTSTSFLTRASHEVAGARILTGDFDGAIKSLQRCLAGLLGDREKLLVLLMLVECLRSVGRLHEAQEFLAFAESLVYPGMEPRYFVEKGCLLRAQGQPARAYEAFERARKSLECQAHLGADASFRQQLLLMLAETAFELGDRQSALANFRQAVDLQDASEELSLHHVLQFAQLLVEQREFALVLSLASRLRNSTNASPGEISDALCLERDIHLHLASERLRSGNVAEAAAEFKLASPVVVGSQDGSKLEQVLDLGEAFLTAGRSELAVTCFQIVLARDDITVQQRERSVGALLRLKETR